MAERLELPKDLIFGEILVHITGQSEIEIENYKGIICYSRERIRLSIPNGQMEITGHSLQIDSYRTDFMKISGKICQVRYIMEGERP